MSTRCVIAMQQNNGKVLATYCGHDGYPEWTGFVLNEYYKEDSMVKKLIDLGDLYAVAPKLEPSKKGHSIDSPEENVTIAYARDGGENIKKPVEYGSINSLLDSASDIYAADYVYVYSSGEWQCADMYGERDLKPIDEVESLAPSTN